ncbi:MULTISPECIES: hydrophobin family protein [unclassified Streptomyces]
MSTDLECGHAHTVTCQSNAQDGLVNVGCTPMAL